MIALVDEEKYLVVERNNIEFSALLYNLQLKLCSENMKESEIAAGELATIGTPAVNVLSAALMHENSHTAVNAARALGIIGPAAKKVVFKLICTLLHSDKDRRAQVAGALGRIKSNPRLSVQALGRTLKDEELVVRQYAAAALGEFDKEVLVHILEELEDAIKDDDLDVQTFAKFALSKVNH